MATGTRPTGKVDRADVPEGMKVFTVSGPTIKDSMDEYCEDSQDAVLDEALAEHYYKLDLIKVDFPDFNAKPQPSAAEASAALAALEANRAQLEADRLEFEKQKQDAIDAAVAEAVAKATAAIAPAETTTKEATDAADKPADGAGAEAEVAAGGGSRKTRA